MLKIIFKQIINRKKSNIWMVVELLLVFMIVWYMVDYFFVLGYTNNIPNHRNIRHTWQLSIDEYPESHSNYREEESTDEAKEANFERLLKTIHDYPEVEAVTVSFDHSEPESTGMSNVSVQRDSVNSVYAQRIQSDPREDFFKVFAYTTADGKKPVSIHNFNLSNANGVVISNSIAKTLFPEKSSVGEEILINGRKFNVVGVVDDIKRVAFNRPIHAVYLFPRFGAGMLNSTKISIRSKASVSNDSFKTGFKKEMQEHLQAGNFYLKNISTYTKAAEELERLFGVKKQVLERAYMMIFFLINILLCVMGTFWYRINTRREEIGTRKALGSSIAQIRNILLSEGLILLTIAAIPAIIMEANFVVAGLLDTIGKDDSIGVKDLYLPDNMYLRFLITNGITWVIMAVVIVSAIWLPARKAALLAPADALHYE
jgi:ABC-type antimicrobial peptide transport system permease subunit